MNFFMSKIIPTVAAADNADNDVAFNWTVITNNSSPDGQAIKLESACVLDMNDGAAPMDLFFCRGSNSGVTPAAPTADQRLGVADAVVDITVAEALAVDVFGHISMTVSEGDILTGTVLTKTNIGLVLQPHPYTNNLYVAGVWRDDPATAGSGAVTNMQVYLGFSY